jgi:AcrR family transcriptional regulator
VQRVGDEVKRIQRPASRRGEQAGATRRRIIAAATVLFSENGYISTTFDQIAERAGVAVQTVYFHFGNKRTVLKEALDVAAVGDDRPVPVLERPWLHEARTATDPNRVVALWVEASRAILDRGAPLMRVLRDAATADSDMAALWATNEQQRAISYRVMAQQLADLGALKPHIQLEQAADILFALLSLEIYLLFTTTRRWTPEQWQQWTIDTVCTALLR